MNKFRKIIFGKKYQFIVDEKYTSLVDKSVEYYPNYEGTSNDVDVFIGIPFAESEQPVSINPKIFSRYPNAFVTDFFSMSIRWILTKEPHLTVYVTLPKYPEWKRILGKLRSIEWSTPLESFEQQLHELLLVPSTYFFTDLVPVHAAAIAHNKKATLIAGTGGTGKTSALLSIRNSANYSFLSDDISIINTNKLVYPNLAWPKIYAYNLIDNESLKTEIFRNRSALDRYHFNIRAQIDASAARRKIQPQRLYNSIEIDGCEFSNVLYLFKEDIPALAVQNLSAENAADMTVSVMQSEYGIFHKFLYWERFNAAAIDAPPIIDIYQIMERWKQQLYELFNGVSVKLVRIPLQMPHQIYGQEIQKIITSMR